MANHSTDGLFDVLGSGPIRAGVEFEAAGAFGNCYQRKSLHQEFKLRCQQMLAELESTSRFLDDTSPPTASLVGSLDQAEYEPIDWHTDIKSGYRWDPETWWLDQKIGNVPGADIKVPWEISRGHDLVANAITSNTTTTIGSNLNLVSLRLLDWIVANPARTGVNWRSTMEVAIRATNWIWALAISEIAAPVSPSIIWIVARSLEQHAEFIRQYPDKGGIGATNHYIADIAGLAHIAAALPFHENAQGWGRYSASGLSEQAALAVTDDGFSYEGSIGYHRYVTELLTHGTLATMRNPGDWRTEDLIDYPKQWRILGKMNAVASTLEKPNGRSPQFGDHDAGRFLKFHIPLTPANDEDPLDYSHLRMLFDGIANASGISSADISFESVLPSLGIRGRNIEVARDMLSKEERNAKMPTRTRSAWVAKSKRIWVAVQTFTTQENEPTGHLHDDALTIELCVDGQDVVVDPGSGVYTADTAIRNTLRSRQQHSTVGPIGHIVEQPDVFNLSQLGSVEIERSDLSSFSATYRTAQWSHNRKLCIGDSHVEITDTFEGEYPWEQVFVFHPDVSAAKTNIGGNPVVTLSRSGKKIMVQPGTGVESVSLDEAMYSPIYGTVISTPRLRIRHSIPGVNVVVFLISDA